jgi:hypothetical protein
MGDELRKRRRGLRRRSGASWHVDETYLKVGGRCAYPYRAIDRDANRVDTMLSEHGDMTAATVVCGSAKATMGFGPDRPGDHRRARLLPKGNPHDPGLERPTSHQRRPQQSS